MIQSTNVLAFFRPASKLGDWTQAELAEFYRVEGALQQAGISVTTDRGVSDQGEPWFVFCREDDEEIIAHFARIGGEYVIVSNVAPGAVRGRDFTSLVRNLLGAHPFVLAKASARHQNIYLHPAALLAALVATAFMNSMAQNDETHQAGQSASEKSSWWSAARHDFAILSAIAIGVLYNDQLDSSERKVADASLLHQDLVANSSHTLHLSSEDISVPDVGGGGRGGGPAEVAGLLGVQIADNQTANSADQCSANSDAAAAQQLKFLAHQHGASGSESGNSDGLAPAIAQHSGADKVGAPSSNCSDFSTIALTQANSQLGSAGSLERGQAVAMTASGDVIQSASPDSGGNHASVASSSGDIVHPIDALNVAAGDLHLPSSSLQTVGLTATNLQDAVQASFAAIFGSAGGTDANSAPASSGTATVSAPSSAPEHLVSASPVATIELPQVQDLPPSFDSTALPIIEEFIKDTANIKVETFGTSMLISDANPSHFLSGHVELDTWQMPDGSTLSILGILPHSAFV
jgi:hypothetical protein